jgi:ribosomal protein S4
MALWKNSSGATLKRRTGKKGLREQTCCFTWKGGWIIWYSAWALPILGQRQLVRHNHFLVSGKPVNIPSYLVKVGDDIQVREGSRKVERILDAMESIARRGVPQWLELDKGNYKGILKVLPTREELTMPVQEQLVVELYSK